jgi:RHS repeat-associated protein
MVYLPFGELSQTNSTGVDKVTKKFTGQEYDEDSGLYYYGSRYYDPKIGRFLSADSIIPDIYNAQAFNRYSYVMNNPIMYMDPSGHGFFLFDWIWDALKAVGNFFARAFSSGDWNVSVGYGEGGNVYVGGGVGNVNVGVSINSGGGSSSDSYAGSYYTLPSTETTSATTDVMIYQSYIPSANPTGVYYWESPFESQPSSSSSGSATTPSAGADSPDVELHYKETILGFPRESLVAMGQVVTIGIGDVVLKPRISPVFETLSKSDNAWRMNPGGRFVDKSSNYRNIPKDQPRQFRYVNELPPNITENMTPRWPNIGPIVQWWRAFWPLWFYWHMPKPNNNDTLYIYDLPETRYEPGR